ncbi:acyl carrier protein [Streptosporangium sp. NPDC051023]|uniref:acyl carrier protein n=1 Tax=Streptosporangium sp. NPDC051023 TaxID=3155410 RepID=UPI00344CE827
MNESEVADVLRKYLEERILDASDVEIELDTPLLEWGILNSLTTTRLVGFIREQFGIEIPVEEMVGGNFKDLLSISRLVVGLGVE